MTTFAEDENNNFIDDVIGTDNLLKDTCEWINENLNVNDVFDDDNIDFYCRTNGWTKY